RRSKPYTANSSSPGESRRLPRPLRTFSSLRRPRRKPSVIVAIHQPHYLPWLRYFAKILRSDVFIVLDDIQYEKNGFQNRNKIKTPQGAQYLTVPVRRPTLRPIRAIEIDNATGWASRHRRALEINYGKAPYFERYW